MRQNKTTTNTNSNFYSSGLRQKVDQMMDILYAGGVNNPMDSIEQISYLLFLRLLSERDEQLAAISKKYKRIFSGKWARYAWGNFVTLTGDQLFDSIRSAIENLHELPDLSNTGKLLFRRATLKIYDRPTLRAVIQSIHEMDLAEHNGSDIKGDMYEYLLSKISMSGTNGQFRTPRHIIDFIVEIVDPKPGRRICDPACGTAGFLISAFNHILKQNTSKADLKTGNVTGDKLKPAQWKFLEQQAFTGFDNDANMIKIAILNLYLHKLEKANIVLHNPLTTTRGGTYPGPQYDCILANPPFSGKVQKESILSDLNHGINTRATELLFLKWFIDHLADKGRAGVIVPEGIIFQSQNAYKKLRKMLVDDYLWCVVSLPAGVFNPYSGVKTSILLMDKMLSKKINKILFVKIENDGFDLGAQRRPIDKNDLPKALDFIKDYKSAVMGGTEVEDTDFAHTVEKPKIAESGDWDLSGERYKDNGIQTLSDFDYKPIGELLDIQSGYAFKSKLFNEDKGFPIIRIRNIKTGFTNTFYDGEYEDEFVVNDGDLLIGMDGEFNATIWNGGQALLNQRVCRLQNFNGCLKEYVFRMIQRKLKEIEDNTYAVTVKHISAKQIKEIKIPLPPLEIQKSIVSEIDGYQKIIDGARQVVNNYKPTIKIDPDWKMVALGEVSTVTSGQSPEGKYYNQNREGMPFYQGKTEFGDIYIGKPQKWTTRVTREAEKGDILMSVRAPVGPVNLATKRCCIGRGLASIRASEKIESVFLFNYLKSIQDRISGSGGAVFDCINRKQITEIQIPFPPLSVQKEIVAQIEAEQQIVNANKKLIEIYEQKIKAKISEVWGFGTSPAAVEDKVDEMADEQVRATTPYKNDAAVVCLLLAQMEKLRRPTTEFFIQKHMFVTKHHLHLPVNSVFKRKVAGPWSQELRWKSIEAAIKMNWLRCEKKRFVAGSAFEKALNHAVTVLGEGTSQIAQLVEDLKTFGQKGLERWTTVLKVVDDLKETQHPITRANIQHEVDTWPGKRLKEIFVEESVDYTIKKMIKYKWLPTTAGQ